MSRHWRGAVAALTMFATLGIVAGVAFGGLTLIPGDPSATDLCRDASGAVGDCGTINTATFGTTSCPVDAVTRCDIDGQPRVETYFIPGCKQNTVPDAGADERYDAGCEPYAYGLTPDVFTITKVAEDATTITLTWSTVPNVVTYRLSREGWLKTDGTQRHSFSSATQARFLKGSTWYQVDALSVAETGRYP